MIGNIISSGLLFLYSTLLGQNGTPKEPLEIELPGKNGLVFKMKMIHCPEGETFISPENSTIKTKIKGFYISDFKITTRQFVALLGEKETTRIKSDLEKLKNESAAKDCLEFNTNYPLLMTTPEMIVQFCLELQKQYSIKNSANADSYKGQAFKIPSHEQWVYSARGSNDLKENPYFGFTLLEKDLKSLPDFDKRKADLAELWKKHSNEEFNFHPRQISKLLGEKLGGEGEMEKIIQFIPWYYGALTGGELQDTLKHLVTYEKSKANTWGFKGSLDPSIEWVMLENRRNTFWKANYDEFTFDKSSWIFSGVKLNHLLKPGKDSDKLKENSAFLFVYPYGKLNPNDEYKEDDFDPADSMPSFRVVAENGLVHDWLFFVNRDIYSAPNTGSADNKIIEMRNYIKELAGSESYLKLFESMVSIYQARLAKKDNGALKTALGFFQESSAADKDFFELLSMTVGN